MDNLDDNTSPAVQETSGVVIGGAAGAARASVVQLEEADHLRYQLIGSKIEHQRLLVDMYAREYQRAQIELANVSQEARKLSIVFEEKYNVDMRLNTVTADGVIAPLPVEQRNAIASQIQQR